MIAQLKICEHLFILNEKFLSQKITAVTQKVVEITIRYFFIGKVGKVMSFALDTGVTQNIQFFC